MLVLSKADIYRVLDWKAAVDAVGEGFAALSSGKAVIPLRSSISVPGKEGLMLLMPGFDGNEGLAVKLVSVFNGNPARGLPLIYGLVTLFDSSSGQPLALLDGATVTAIRTGAASGVATRYMANPEADILALFGAGVQAETQLLAIAAVRSLSEVRVYSPRAERSLAFATRMSVQCGLNVRAVAGPAEALKGASIVAAATTSTTPVFEDGQIGPGTHINGVGSYTPEMREIPGETVARARLVVDSREGCLSEAGDVLIPLKEGAFKEEHICAELGDVVVGRYSGRTNREQVTFFKSVGNAIQDIALAGYLYRAAINAGLGTNVDL